MKGFESDRIHASALVVQDYSHHYSHWDAKESLADWLKRENIPGLTGFDTRMLTRKIRSKGAMLARMELEGQSVRHSAVSQSISRRISQLLGRHVMGSQSPVFRP